MSKKKILHVTFDMTIGGTQQVIRQIIEGVDKNLYESSIVCIDNEIGELGQILEHSGIPIYCLNRKPGFDWAILKGIRSLVIQHEIDLLHCHQYSPYLYGVLAVLLLDTRVIFTEHGRFYPDYGTWKRKLVNPVLQLFTNQITTISSATKDALICYENFSRKNIQVIYNGIKDNSDLIIDVNSLKKKFNIPENHFVFGTISRLQPIKNQTMMIQAFSQVLSKHSDIFLLMVGDGESRSELEQLVDDLGIRQHVTFIGFQNDPYQFHRIIDVFLLSSFSEGTSMTLLEAMSFSKPSVVTHVGGNPEIIEDGCTGFIVASDDTEMFSSRCNDLYENQELYKQIALACRTAYLEKFVIEKMSLSYHCLYSKLLD